jgi:hypothetical protein
MNSRPVDQRHTQGAVSDAGQHPGVPVAEAVRFEQTVPGDRVIHLLVHQAIQGLQGGLLQPGADRAARLLKGVQELEVGDELRRRIRRPENHPDILEEFTQPVHLQPHLGQRAFCRVLAAAVA